MTDFSYQLYCSRNWPLKDSLATVAKAGFTQVEGYGALIDEHGAADLAAELAEHGLRMTSSHIGVSDILDRPDTIIAQAATLGMTKVFAPYLPPEHRPTTADGWRDIAKDLGTSAKTFKAAGITLGWHNHDFECVEVDGILPLDALAQAPDVMLELDLGWVARAGHDPVEWIEKYGPKITAVHVKDIAPAGTATDEDGWADVGHGIMDWTAIHAALSAAGVSHYVAEHDNPSDHARFATRSLATLNAL